MAKRSGYPKLMNEYAMAVGDIYRDTPKAVWAAIAVSRLTTGGDFLSEARELVLSEWLVLHQNGIVPQKPPVA